MNQRYVLEPNGTMHDRLTDLVWMIPLAGQTWFDGESQGQPTYLSWKESTSRYGRGRTLAPSNGISPYWSFDNPDKPALTQTAYAGYVTGEQAYEFAGHSDWRMPVIEEWLTVDWKNTGVDCDWYSHSGLNMANPSNFERGWLQNVLNMDYEYKWWADVDTVFADISASSTSKLRLVRNGSLFTHR